MILACDYCGQGYAFAAQAVVDAMDDRCCPACEEHQRREYERMDDLDVCGWTIEHHAIDAAATVAQAVNDLPF